MRRWPLFMFAAAYVAMISAASACRKDESKRSAETTAPAGEAVVEPEPAGEILFHKVVPKPGQRTESAETTELKTSLVLQMKGAAAVTVDLEHVERETKKVEVLASDKAITKVRVTYLVKEETEKEKGKEQRKTSPVTGKTYLVELKDGSPYVSTMGAPAPPDEAGAVLSDYRTLGKVDPVLDALPDKPLKVGEVVPPLAEAIKAFLAESAEDEVSDASVKLAEIRAGPKGKLGVFDVSVTVKVRKAGESLDVKMVLTGTMVVRAVDGWVTSLDLAGPVTMEDRLPGAKAKVDQGGFSGKGNAKMTRLITHL